MIQPDAAPPQRADAASACSFVMHLSTNLADLLTPRLVANPFSAMRASLRGTVESGTDSVSADLGGAVGTDTASVEREAALSCARRSFANKRLKMLGAAVGKLWTTQDARCDYTL
jgi:hypothetical protein